MTRREKSVKWLSDPGARPQRGEEAVYVAACAGFVKVGRTTDPASRFLDTAFPIDVVIEHLAFVPADICGEVEREALRSLAAHRHRGEWFMATVEQAVEAVNIAATRVIAASPARREALREAGWTHAMMAVIDF